MRKGSLFAFMAVFLCSVLSAQAQGQQGQQTPLPDGKGREMVQATCTRCHGLNLITNSGGTRGRDGSTYSARWWLCPGSRPRYWQTI
jgi:cytochrome c553